MPRLKNMQQKEHGNHQKPTKTSKIAGSTAVGHLAVALAAVFEVVALAATTGRDFITNPPTYLVQHCCHGCFGRPAA
jgi:hypothetical protein